MNFEEGMELNSETVNFFDVDWHLQAQFRQNNDNQEYLSLFVHPRHNKENW